MRSPSLFSHLTIVPASMPWPRRGSLTSVAIAGNGPVDRLEHVRLVRDDELLHDGREGQRREARADALDRRVEEVERAVLEQRRHLRAEAPARDRLVRDDAAVRLLDRAHERLLVERL